MEELSIVFGTLSLVAFLIIVGMFIYDYAKGDRYRWW